MITRKFKEHTSTKTFKILISILVYLIFTFYTVSFYKGVPIVYKKAYLSVQEKILSNKKNVIVGGTSILVEIVDTPQARELGLSGRAGLANDNGMLFVFEKPDIYGFWMKEMNFDLDIIWFNEYGEIVYFVEHAKPSSYPKTFTPDKEALYVLEVPAGFVKKEYLKLGDKIDLY
jgi:uncharacterized membrane protein (UPF0127 family)